MRRQRHLKQAASRFLRQSLVNHLSREQPCLQMIGRTFPSCPSSGSEPNLSYWTILSRIRFKISLRATCPIPFVADQERETRLSSRFAGNRLRQSCVTTIELCFVSPHTTCINGFPGGSTSPISTAGTPALVRAMSKDAASERASESSSPPSDRGATIMERILVWPFPPWLTLLSPP